MSQDDLKIPTTAPTTADVGFVLIGRNEGERLKACIASVLRETQTAIYVDSGSVDGSAEFARSQGLTVVEIDLSRPFTAARARNAGVEAMRQHHPEIEYVHFVDGDCKLVEGWLPAALEALLAEPDLAAVCGRRRERFPENSPYNQLCDDEWDTPIGLAPTVGGDALFRLEPFLQVNGFSPGLIAGEEPDLCHRIRLNGWKIRRLDLEMTLHDAAMTRFSQWWQRNRRSGFATIEALALRGQGNRRMLREVVSNFGWAFPLFWPFSPVLWLAVCLRSGPLQASFITLGKLPHAQGQIDYLRKRDRLIEYK